MVYLSQVPPRVTFKVQFKKQIPGDQFTFYFIDNTGGKNKTVGTYNLYKGEQSLNTLIPA